MHHTLRLRAMHVHCLAPTRASATVPFFLYRRCKLTQRRVAPIELHICCSPISVARLTTGFYYRPSWNNSTSGHSCHASRQFTR